MIRHPQAILEAAARHLSEAEREELRVEMFAALLALALECAEGAEAGSEVER